MRSARPTAAPALPIPLRVSPRLRRIAGPAFGITVLAVALAGLGRELHGARLRDVLRQVGEIPAHSLLLALLFTAGSYLALTGYDALSLRYVRRQLPYHRIALASFINYAFSQALGFPLLTGGAVRYRLYSGWGLSAIQVTNVVAFASFTFWLGVLAVGGVVLSQAPPAFADWLGWPPLVVRIGGIAMLLVVAAYLWWTLTGKRIVRVRGWRFRRPTTRLAALQLAVACLDWTLACAVLHALLPAGSVSFASFLPIFLLAFVAGIVSNVPGGLGVFESVLLLLLPDSVDGGRVLAALVAYRAIYYLAPLLVAAGCLATYELLRQRMQLSRLAVVFGRWVPALAPTVFAVTTFAGGVILLLSGATPATTGRLRWINDVLPLPVVELSHFLASLAGIGLVLLAHGLQRRLDAAYHAVVVLLAAGIVFSLAKGLDYEEATALTLMLLTLIPARRHFFRKASIWAEPLTAGSLTAVAAVLLGTLWLGLFSFQREQYSAELWWRFAWTADAPRFLRAMVGVSVAVIVVALRHLMRAAPPDPVAPTAADLDRAHTIALASSDTTAHLALLGDKTLLFADTNDAFLMFATEGRSWIALGDAVGAPDRADELTWRFRELVDRHGGWPVFYLVRADRLDRYVDLGLALFKLGEEAHVPLADFSLDGRSRKSMRRVVNAVEREGATFEVLSVQDGAAIVPELRAISNSWLTAKSTREKGFSLGAFHEDYIRRFPIAVVRRDGRIVAFANVLCGTDRQELSIDLMRYDPETAPENVMEYLLVRLMEWGRADGYAWFNLGMAPLSGLGSHNLAPVWNRVGALVFRLGEHFYNFQGLRAYKEKFDPVWTPRYIAAPSGIALPRVLTNVATLIGGGLRGVLAR